MEFPTCVEVWSSLGACNTNPAEPQCRPRHHRHARFYADFLGGSVRKGKDDDAWIEKQDVCFKVFKPFSAALCLTSDSTRSFLNQSNDSSWISIDSICRCLQYIYILMQRIDTYNVMCK